VVQKLNNLLGQGPLPSAEDANMTVKAWLQHWIENVAPARARSPQTLSNDRWAVDQHLIPALGRRKLAALSTEDVEHMLVKLARADAEGKGGLSKNSLLRIRMVLGKALDEAIRRDRLRRGNVAKLAVLPMDARPAKEGRSLSPAEAKKLLEAARNKPNGALVPVGLMLGLRPGELTGLVWDNVDFKNRRLTVDKALVRGPGSQLVRAEPKTRKSRRVVDMPAPVVDALRRHRDAQTLRQVAGDDFVFKTAAGTPLDPSNLRRFFDAVCEAAKIGSWTPSELRHSAASLLSAAGVPIDQAADLLGHADTRMLDRHYRHATTKSYGAAVAPMEALFAT
jgi:integrase